MKRNPYYQALKQIAGDDAARYMRDARHLLHTDPDWEWYDAHYTGEDMRLTLAMIAVAKADHPDQVTVNRTDVTGWYISVDALRFWISEGIIDYWPIQDQVVFYR